LWWLHLLDDSVMSFSTFVQKCEDWCTWFWQDVMLSGGDVTDADGLSYASESTAAILMLIFQYVSNGGTKIKVSLYRGSKSNLYTLYYSFDRGGEYCDEHVCMCVCLSVSDHIFGTTWPIFTKFFVHVTCSCGSFLLWRRSGMLRISSFVDDIVFARKLRLLDVAARLWLRQWGLHLDTGLGLARRNTRCRQLLLRSTSCSQGLLSCSERV